MAKIEHMRLIFGNRPDADTAEKRQVEEMAQKVVNEINEPVKELIKRLVEMQREHLDDEELGKWIGIQTLVPLSSLIISTFTTISVNKPTYDLYMEKVWAAIEESRETSAKNDRKEMLHTKVN